MPYLNEPTEEELQKQQNISGQSSVVNTEAPTKAGGPQASGSFTNLNQYLDANKENAVQLGQGVAGHIENQGNEARTGIQNTEADFNQLADKGTLKDLDKAPEEAQNIIKQASTGTKNAQVNQAQTSRFGEIANATYKGPKDLTGSSYYNDTNQKYQKAQEAKQNASSDEGRFSLLKSAYARPTYSQGQQNLDNLLLTGNNQAKTTVQSAANGLSDLEGKWTGAQTNAANLATKRQADTNAARAQSRTNALQAQFNRNAEVDSDLDAKQANWANEYNQYKDLLGAYKGGDLNLTRQQADRLALKDSGQGIYNLLNGTQPESYLDLQAFDANKVIGQDQFAQLAALDKLTNQFSSPAMSRFTDESQAGTLDATKAFNASRFGQAANQAETGFQDWARNTNTEAYGSDTQNWEENSFNKGSEARSSRATGNVKGFLDGAGFSLNGVDQVMGGSSGQVLLPINEVLSGITFGALGQGGARDGAALSAQRNSEVAASTNYYNEIQKLLNEQGSQNKIKVT
ncbi:MAG: hypothetical protein JNM39_18635 [Bdellovibrionaceae bacterium]|nr:hypothetical protein [Pseudobdellovibrionaceae bacterium]